MFLERNLESAHLEGSNQSLKHWSRKTMEPASYPQSSYLKIPTLTSDPKTNYESILPLFISEAFNWTEVFEDVLPIMQKQNYHWAAIDGIWHHTNGATVSFTTIQAIVAERLFSFAQSNFQISWKIHKENIAHSIQEQVEDIAKDAPLMRLVSFLEIARLFFEYGFDWDPNFYRWYHQNGASVAVFTLFNEVEKTLRRLMPNHPQTFSALDNATDKHKQICLDEIREMILQLIEFQSPREASADEISLESPPPANPMHPRAKYAKTIALFEKECFNWTKVFKRLVPTLIGNNYHWSSVSDKWHHPSGATISPTTMKALITQIIFSSTPSKFQSYWDLNESTIKESIQQNMHFITNHSRWLQMLSFQEMNALCKQEGLIWDPDFYLWHHENGVTIPSTTLFYKLISALDSLMPNYAIDLATFCYKPITSTMHYPLSLDQVWMQHEPFCKDGLKIFIAALLVQNKHRSQ